MHGAQNTEDSLKSILLKKLNSWAYDYKKINSEWTCCSSFADCSQVLEQKITL